MSGWYFFFFVLLHLLLKMAGLHCFYWWAASPRKIYHIFFSHSPADGHLIVSISWLLWAMLQWASFQISLFPFPDNHHPSFSVNVYWSSMCINWPLCSILTTLLRRIHYHSPFTLQNIDAQRGKGLWPYSQGAGKLGFELRSLLPGPKVLPTALNKHSDRIVILELTQCCLEIKLLEAGDDLSPSRGDWLPGQVPSALVASSHSRGMETPRGCESAWILGPDILRSCLRQRGHQTELLGNEQPKSP